eukprot:TRINITY_DN1813_c0_g1_i1.p1 TRINITY_DN1813_c0_g1~~TRINITY_DN1813_c0_g1_i1.p1  ORF type:complete len:275 (-),score=75.84 TRINITY_DN1813_c0_g1_i1:220-1044(-)
MSLSSFASFSFSCASASSSTFMSRPQILTPSPVFSTAASSPSVRSPSITDRVLSPLPSPSSFLSSPPSSSPSGQSQTWTKMTSLERALVTLEGDCKEVAENFLRVMASLQSCMKKATRSTVEHMSLLHQSSKNVRTSVEAAVVESQNFMNKCLALDQELSKLDQFENQLGLIKNRLKAMETFVKSVPPSVFKSFAVLTDAAAAAASSSSSSSISASSSFSSSAAAFHSSSNSTVAADCQTIGVASYFSLPSVSVPGPGKDLTSLSLSTLSASSS